MPSTIRVTLLPEDFLQVLIVARAGSHAGDINRHAAMDVAGLLWGVQILQGSVRFDSTGIDRGDCFQSGTARHATIAKPVWPRTYRDLPVRHVYEPGLARPRPGFVMQPLQPGPLCLCHE